MNEIVKKEVAGRLKLFIKKEFDSVSEAARRMQIPEGTLRYAYLNAKSLPGFEVLYQLLNNGCDIKWLMTGKKSYLNIEMDKLKTRIDNQITILKSKFQIKDDDLVEYNIFKDQELNLESDRLLARQITRVWMIKGSLLPSEFVDLARLSNCSLSWLLCGSYGPEKEYIDNFLLSYPEIELVYKLKNNPALFDKVKSYVEAKLNEHEIDNQSS